jgi:thymidine kinase
LDVRFGALDVTSRAGLSEKADFLITKETNILQLNLPPTPIHCILVDEAQFLEVEHVDQLRLATEMWQVPIICYGLRTDFRTHLFPGSRRLLELADVIEEVETCCFYCTKKAVLNLKHVNGIADTTGPTVQLGAEEKYYPVCFECYRQSVVGAEQSPVPVWNSQMISRPQQQHKMGSPAAPRYMKEDPMEESK